ncbi:MAG: glycosyltransferase [Acidimicrobiia bacterium]
MEVQMHRDNADEEPGHVTMKQHNQSHAQKPLADSNAANGELGPGLPFLKGGGFPKPESSARTRLIRSVAVAALVVSAVYLVWRTVFTIDLGVWFVAVPLLILEAHHALGLGVYTFSLWDVSAPPVPPPVIATHLRVAVLIPTYDESIEVLLPVISAALAVQPAHETWVLDDGDRADVAQLAADLGAQYLARADNTDAKAGNLNSALEHIEADIVAVVDADHVVLPGILTNTLGYFDDPKIAVVQTPQDFYNVDSFEHQDRGEDGEKFNEQAVFNRLIHPAKYRWNAVSWCGTGALVRVEALRDVGGVATDSLTEDIQTSIRMHKAGWQLVAHNEVLARGLAATTMPQYMLQRERWARGAMQVMKSERLLTSRALTPAQRLAYSATLFAWFDSLRSLLFVLLPIAVILTGAIPVDASLIVFGPMFLGVFFMQLAALRLLTRGHSPAVLSLTFDLLRMPAVIPALGELLTRGGDTRRFDMTPKGRVERTIIHAPRMLTGLILLTWAAMGWAALTIAGVTPMEYRYPGAILGVSVVLAGNVGLLLAATRRVRDPRFAGELRGSVRFPVDLEARVGDHQARIVDLSLTGARVLIPGLDPDSTGVAARMPFRIITANLEFGTKVIWTRDAPEGGTDVGLQFLPEQHSVVQRLALLLFHAKTDQPSEESNPRSEKRQAS